MVHVRHIGEVPLSTQTIRIATRQSPLALWQAEHVKRMLCERHPDLHCSLVPIQTTGDKISDQPLRTSGGKGLFLKELERSLLNQETDIAVHSMKDVPVKVPDGLVVHSIGLRGAFHDVWVGAGNPLDFPVNGRIGTSSSRRRALAAHLFKRKDFVEIRGNVQTRLRKLDDGEADALILAEAGLDRLGLQSRMSYRLPESMFVPAVGQGVLAVEYLQERRDLEESLQSLVNGEVEQTVKAERQVAALLEADCSLPFGAHCVQKSKDFQLRAVVLSVDGERAIFAHTQKESATKCAEVIAARLERQGADRLLQVS